MSPLPNVLWWLRPTRPTSLTLFFSLAGWADLKSNSFLRVFINSVWRWTGRQCVAIKSGGGGGFVLCRLWGRGEGFVWSRLLLGKGSPLHFLVCEDGLCKDVGCKQVWRGDQVEAISYSKVSKTNQNPSYPTWPLPSSTYPNNCQHLFHSTTHVIRVTFSGGISRFQCASPD